MIQLTKKDIQALKDLYQIKEGIKNKNDINKVVKKITIAELKKGAC